MHRKLTRTIGVTAMLCLLAAGNCWSQNDAALLRDLDSSSTFDAENAAIAAIRERVKAGPLSAADTDAVLEIFLNRESLADRWAYTLLPELAAGQNFSQPGLAIIADSLSNNYQFSPGAKQTLIDTLSAVEQLPNQAYTSLIAVSQGPNSVSQHIATPVLGYVPIQHERRDDVIAELTRLLQPEIYDYLRYLASEALHDIARRGALPKDSIAALAHTVATDSHMHIRIEAAEALAEQSLEPAAANEVALDVIAAMAPNSAPLKASRGFYTSSTLHDRANSLLANLDHAPYADEIARYWIADVRRTLYTAEWENLEQHIESGDLTAAQHRALLEQAARIRAEDRPAKLYSLIYQPANQHRMSIVEAVETFSQRAAAADRKNAAYRLLTHHNDGYLPQGVADTAAKLVALDMDTGTLVAAAELLLKAADDRERRDRQLGFALKLHAANRDFYSAIVGLLSADQLGRYVVQFANNDSLPTALRYTLIDMLGHRAEPDNALPTDVLSALQTAARTSEDNLVVQAAGQTLAAWGAKPPVRVTMMNRENQSAALGYLFLGMLVFNLVVGITGLIAIIRMPLARKSAAKRAGMIIGWLLLSIVLVTTLVIAVIGFIGHNSAPRPSYTLGFNAPAYIATAIYAALALAALRRTKRGLPVAADRS